MYLRFKIEFARLAVAAFVSAVSAAATADVESRSTGGVGTPTQLIAPRNSLSRNAVIEPDIPVAIPKAADTSSVEFTRLTVGEFEQYASKLAGADIRRLGSELMLGDQNRGQNESSRQVPADYLIGIGDEIQITIWGSVDADLRLTVDNGGRIVIPRIGPVVVAGVRYADLNDALSRRVSQLFKNFQLSATLGRLRSIRFYVTGFTSRPGAYTVSSLATVMTGLIQAGGPSAAGSFREIELRRRGHVVSRFDLYDLIIRGDKSGDIPLQADDVLHIGAVGPQIAMIGSVNRPAVLELKASETVSDALGFVGGLTAVADQSRLAIERLRERNDRRVDEIILPAGGQQQLSNGDVLRAFSGVDAMLPQFKQYKRVRVEGEVARPGDYLMPPASTLQDAIEKAGGLTSQAYLFGTEFSRENVRVAQEQNYDRALRELEIEFTRSSTTKKALTADEVGAQAQQRAGTERLIERLRAARPTGRIVLQILASSTQLPTLGVEDGDRIKIPSVPNTVGVFGSVFNAGSYLLREELSVEDVMKLAGGTTRGADINSVFVIRANGAVVSARQLRGGWLGAASGMSTIPAIPGDTVFVPEEINKTTFSQEAKDWTQILYQFGIGAAALKTIKN